METGRDSRMSNTPRHFLSYILKVTNYAHIVQFNILTCIYQSAKRFCIRPNFESDKTQHLLSLAKGLKKLCSISDSLPLAASVRASVISMCLPMVLYFDLSADNSLFSFPSSSKQLISSSK